MLSPRVAVRLYQAIAAEDAALAERFLDILEDSPPAAAPTRKSRRTGRPIGTKKKDGLPQRILGELAGGRSLTAELLAQMLDASPATMATTLSRLANKGEVQRDGDHFSIRGSLQQ